MSHKKHKHLYRYNEELDGSGSCHYRSTLILLKIHKLEDAKNSGYYLSCDGRWKDLNNLLHEIDERLNQ